MKLSIKEAVITGLVILTTLLFVGTLGYFYLPAGIALGAMILGVGGFAFDGLSEEEQIYRTSPWLLPSAFLIFVASLACLRILGDFLSWIMS